MFIRSIWYDFPITVFFDWWAEFVSNSDKKLLHWNSILASLNIFCELYNWPKDSRKNLFERSHRIDNEEFLVSRWAYVRDVLNRFQINSNKQETYVKQYSIYKLTRLKFRTSRSCSWILIQKGK